MPCQIGGISICASNETCDPATDRCVPRSRRRAGNNANANANNNNVNRLYRAASAARRGVNTNTNTASKSKSKSKTASKSKSQTASKSKSKSKTASKSKSQTASKSKASNSNNSAYSNSNRYGCEAVLTIPQVTYTCWWNAVLMMLFFSQGVRGCIKVKADVWIAHHGQTSAGRRIVSDILKLLASYKSSARVSRRVFNDLTPEHLLETLHDYYPKKFAFDHRRHSRNTPNVYMEHMLAFLGVSTLDINVDEAGRLSHAPRFQSTVNGTHANFDAAMRRAARGNGDTIAVSAVPSGRNGGLQIHTFKRRDRASLRRSATSPRVIRVNFDTTYGYLNISNEYRISGRSFSPALDSDAMPERFSYGGHAYVADSMYLANYSDGQGGCSVFHAICGVTCGGRRFMYNGAMTFRNTPCELMPFDWIRSTRDFCINPRECGISGALPGELCFNVTRGRRMYLYVRT